jgi:hypothetical protein
MGNVQIYTPPINALFSPHQFSYLTMRTIMDEFKKTYDVESIDKDLKSQIRENVDKVFAEMNEQEGQFLYFCNI